MRDREHHRRSQACGGFETRKLFHFDSEAQKYLKGIDYPADRATIVKKAKENGADESIIQALEHIPDRQYNGPNAVSKELGGQS
ncbi:MULTISPECIES: DUF2795 domain-containing protein [unclassified Frankia]